MYTVNGILRYKTLLILQLRLVSIQYAICISWNTSDISQLTNVKETCKRARCRTKR